MSEVMIVDPKILPNAPKALQDYVREFFTEKSILGKKCLVAGRSALSDRFSKGIAPSHSLELRRWKEGLPEGQELGEWIRKQAEAGKGIWLLYGPDPPSYGAYDDD